MGTKATAQCAVAARKVSGHSGPKSDAPEIVGSPVLEFGHQQAQPLVGHST